MAAIANEAVAEWEPLIYRLARNYEGWNGAELDDLAQEGRIAVWLTLRNELSPNERFIRQRMSAWCRYLGSQIPANYEDMLPLEAAEVVV